MEWTGDDVVTCSAQTELTTEKSLLSSMLSPAEAYFRAKVQRDEDDPSWRSCFVLWQHG